MNSSSFSTPDSLTSITCDVPEWGRNFRADSSVDVTIMHQSSEVAFARVQAVPKNDDAVDDFEFFVAATNVLKTTDKFGALGGDVLTFEGAGFYPNGGMTYLCRFYAKQDGTILTSTSVVGNAATTTEVCL